MADQDHGPHRRRFRSALDALAETSREEVAPGEALDWLAKAEPACAQVEERWTPYRDRLRSTFQDIEENDISLLHRVEQLRQDGRALEARWAELRERMGRSVDEELGTGYEAAAEQVLALKGKLADWVHDAQQLDAAATTWLLESVYRERGVTGGG